MDLQTIQQTIVIWISSRRVNINFSPEADSKILLFNFVSMFITTLYSIIRLLTPLKYPVFESIMGNGAFALLEQMLHFPYYFQNYSKL